MFFFSYYLFCSPQDPWIKIYISAKYIQSTLTQTYKDKIKYVVLNSMSIFFKQIDTKLFDSWEDFTKTHVYIFNTDVNYCIVCLIHQYNCHLNYSTVHCMKYIILLSEIKWNKNINFFSKEKIIQFIRIWIIILIININKIVMFYYLSVNILQDIVPLFY